MRNRVADGNVADTLACAAEANVTDTLAGAMERSIAGAMTGAMTVIGADASKPHNQVAVEVGAAASIGTGSLTGLVAIDSTTTGGHTAAETLADVAGAMTVVETSPVGETQ